MQKLSAAIFFVCLTALSLDAAVADRIKGNIDPTHTVQLPTQPRIQLKTSEDLGPAKPDFLISGITLVLLPDSQQQAALNSLLESQRDPGSADYQQWLTPEQYADRFGATESDIAKLTAWLNSQNLAVDRTARGRNLIVISGTAAAVSSAFKTDIHSFKAGSTLHFANTISPSIPQALAGVVSEIRGLDDFKPVPMHVKMRATSPSYTASSTTHYLAPDDIAAIYDIAPLLSAGINGQGQRIVIVGQTDVNLADIQSFRSQFGLSANIPQVILTGRDPGISTNDVIEADLDLEWSGAVARNAAIIYVNSLNVFNSAQYAIDQNLAPVISMSYGGCEIENSSSLRSIARQANAEGITWIASSGDSGAAGCDSSSASIATHGLAVNIPASFPEVTAIGGTTFAENSSSDWASTNSPTSASATTYIPEASWNNTATRNELSASGGGASIYYAKPSWQSGTGVPGDGMRDVPDIAFSASPDHDGYLMVSGGSLYIVGGTSVPTPVFAGVVGLLNEYLINKGKIQAAGLGNINPSLYHVWQTASFVFHDVTTGNNIVPCQAGTTNCTTGSFGYSATSGYDQVTGLGSVDINQLFANWSGVVSSISTTTSLSASPTSIAENASTQLTAVVRPASGSIVPTGNVTFSSGAAKLGTVALTASGTAALASLNTPGTSLATGNNPITATYSGDASFAGSSGTTSVTVNPTAGTSTVVPLVTPDPVYEQSGSWTFTITLKDTSSIATTLTGLTVNGSSYAGFIGAFFGTSAIPANGSIAANLRMTGLTPPANIVFGFSGVDASGHQWSQSVTVPFDAAAPYVDTLYGQETRTSKERVR